MLGTCKWGQIGKQGKIFWLGPPLNRIENTSEIHSEEGVGFSTEAMEACQSL